VATSCKTARLVIASLRRPSEYPGLDQPRHLVVSVDGQTAGDWLVAEPKRYELSLTLTPGQHQIEYRTLDAPERPSRTVGGTDARLISIGVTGVELRPGGSR
jgi:hypothetical protein